MSTIKCALLLVQTLFHFIFIETDVINSISPNDQVMAAYIYSAN